MAGRLEKFIESFRKSLEETVQLFEVELKEQTKCIGDFLTKSKNHLAELCSVWKMISGTTNTIKPQVYSYATFDEYEK